MMGSRYLRVPAGLQPTKIQLEGPASKREAEVKLSAPLQDRSKCALPSSTP
jgi:hypothetical protein